jgi:hypothetical protein
MASRGPDQHSAVRLSFLPLSFLSDRVAWHYLREPIELVISAIQLAPDRFVLSTVLKFGTNQTHSESRANPQDWRAQMPSTLTVQRLPQLGENRFVAR